MTKPGVRSWTRGTVTLRAGRPGRRDSNCPMAFSIDFIFEISFRPREKPSGESSSHRSPCLVPPPPPPPLKPDTHVVRLPVPSQRRRRTARRSPPRSGVSCTRTRRPAPVPGSRSRHVGLGPPEAALGGDGVSGLDATAESSVLGSAGRGCRRVPPVGSGCRPPRAHTEGRGLGCESRRTAFATPHQGAARQ